MQHISLIIRRLLCTALIMGLAAPLFAASALSGTVNVNTASAAQLQQLPGIGAAKAQAIVEQRKQGKFGAAKDLMNIRGIGPKMFAKIEKHVSVSGSTTLKASSTPAKR